MNVNSIAKYMYFSRAIDLTPEKDRYLRLPDNGMRRTVLMTPNRAATFSSACSRRTVGMLTV
ncbi:MAG: hypothetical protein IT583_05020 [Verrucomicrobia bacterium]|nr:hypothetical protein [Verrucomicrobiota bacterium]